MELDPRLESIAAPRGGLFTAAEAAAAGYNAAEVKWLLRRKEWMRLRRGIYVGAKIVPDDPAEFHVLKARAVLLRLRGQTYVSHISAIAVHDLPTYQPDWSSVHVTRTGSAASRTEAGVHHHAALIPPQYLTNVGGISVTSVAWSIVDLAREATFAQALITAEAALYQERVTLEELREVLFLCRDWPGARQAGRVVSFASTKSATPGETLSRIAFEIEGIRQPEQQVAIYDKWGLVGCVDFLWEDERTIGEFDGRVKYEGKLARDDTLIAEKRREDRLRELGYEVTRFDYALVVAPKGRLGRRIRAAFARAAKRTA